MGALVRAALGNGWEPGTWPWATLTANLTGTLILAALAAVLARRSHLPHWLHPLVAVGFCGSLTTFSGLQVEAFLMVRDGRSPAAISYVATSIVLGFVAAAAARRTILMVTR